MGTDEGQTAEKLRAAEARCRDLEQQLTRSRKKLQRYANQVEHLGMAAAAMLTVRDEQQLFDMISRAIVDHSDFQRVLISLFKEAPPYRDIIGFGGVDEETVDRLRAIDMPKTWYDGVFERGQQLGRLSYYIPHTMKALLNKDATLFGTGTPPPSADRWASRRQSFCPDERPAGGLHRGHFR
jgi:hypothetical protein